MSAQIAWQQLDQGTRKKVVDLLAHHPDYEHWMVRAKDNASAAAAFLEASTWPDDIKSDRRFYDAGEGEPTGPLVGFPDTQRHRDWHYINRPLANSLKTSGVFGELDKRLDLLSKVLGNKRASKQQQAYALPWLIHLTADAHQPLHVVSRYDATGRSDEGGNRLFIEHPFHPRLSSMSLHAYWDDLAGPPWLRGERLEQATASIIASHPQPPAPGGVQRWLQESWEIARDSAYPISDDPVPTLSAEFHMRAQMIALQRIADAGYRLAELLKRVLNEKKD